MGHATHLSRVDIRIIEDRGTGALTLRYVGRKLRFTDRLYGYPDGTFFAVVLAEVPLPEQLVELAASVGKSLDSLPATAELRRAVADVLIVEAMMEAPEYLAMIASPRASWLDVDMRELEHKSLVAENRVSELSASIKNTLTRLRAKPVFWPSIGAPTAVAPASLFGMLPPFFEPLTAPPPPPPEEEQSEEIEEATIEPIEPASETTGRKILAAVKTAREQELPQRLPGGARRALSRLPAGIYVAIGVALERKGDICAALVAGAEGGKRGGEVAVIDWDGEWPVVARRYGAHGRIVYRVEDALRRNGIATEAA